MNDIKTRILIITLLQLISTLGFTLDTNIRNYKTKYKNFIPIEKNHLEPKQGHLGPIAHSNNQVINPHINKYINSYKSRWGKKNLESILRKSHVYRKFIHQRIDYYQLPEELFFLPVVESAYNPNALSKSGALGLWQFMTNSIEPFDININKWVDERRDFWKSTDGALRKLKYNYSKLNDWYLAIAAYNCGLGRMERIIKESGINDFWVLSSLGLLPNETKEYVPKFLAAAHVGTYPGRYGIKPSWKESITWERVKIDTVLDLSLLTKKIDIKESVLKIGNAELNYNFTPPNYRPYYLKIPKEYSDKITKAINTVPGEFIAVNFYTIKGGDTLFELSKHYEVSVKTLKRFNHNLDEKNLRIGQKIVIPSFKETVPFNKNEREFTQFETTQKYKVQPGDTLWGLSKIFNTFPEEIAFNNKISVNSILTPGDILLLPIGQGD